MLVFSGISYHRRHTLVYQLKHTKDLFEAHTCFTGESTRIMLVFRDKLPQETHTGLSVKTHETLVIGTYAFTDTSTPVFLLVKHSYQA